MHTIDPKYALDEKSAKLYQLIIDYKLSDEDYMMLEMIKYKTCEEIEHKFRNSRVNNTYKFPRKFSLLQDSDSSIDSL